MPQVSIIIPLYNKARSIARAIRSVMRQDISDVEIIVIDDGSTDEGPRIVRDFHDHRIRIRTQPNSGPGAARNAGLAMATAPYVTFLDADDEWLSGFLRRTVTSLQENPDCPVCITGHLIGPRARPWPGLAILDVSDGPWRLPTDIEPGLMGASLAMIHSAGSVLCRSGLVERFGGFYQHDGCTFGEDLYLWLKVMLNCTIYRHRRSYLWQHTEDSALASAGRSPGRNKLMPYLLDTGPIYESCPPQYRDSLDRFLAREALSYAHDAAAAGDIAAARMLMDRFHGMRRWKYKYAKLLAKVSLPALTRILARRIEDIEPVEAGKCQ